MGKGRSSSDAGARACSGSPASAQEGSDALDRVFEGNEFPFEAEVEVTASQDFCTKVGSPNELWHIVSVLSGADAYFSGHLQAGGAGALRCTAWCIVVSEKGVYVQGSVGPIHGPANGRDLVRREVPVHQLDLLAGVLP